MLDWWRRLPAFIRYPIATAILLLSSWLFFQPPAPGSRGGAGVALLYAIGLILFFTGPTDAQKKGYHDF
jgi:hypothetical protein